MRRPMTISDDVIDEFENFKYLVQNDDGFGMDVKHRIKCGWIKWRKTSGVLCNKRISMRLKGKFYRSVVTNYAI
jgi:hypothetical protein